MIVKVPKKYTRLECNNYRAIRVLSAITKIVAKMVLEPTPQRTPLKLN